LKPAPRADDIFSVEGVKDREDMAGEIPEGETAVNHIESQEQFGRKTWKEIQEKKE